jgi:hypothetical protein
LCAPASTLFWPVRAGISRRLGGVCKKRWWTILASPPGDLAMMSMRRSSRVFLAFAPVLLLVSPALAGTILYQTGFESPTFSPGPLNGAGGWIANNSAVLVQSSVSHSGSQAVQIDATGLFSQAGGFEPLNYSAAGSPEPVVHAQIWFQQSSAGTVSNWTVLGASGNGGFIGQIILEQSGIARLNVGGASTTVVPRGGWNLFELVLNFDTQTQSAYFNGQPIAENAAFVSPSTTLSSIGFAMNSRPGTDQGYYDDLSVTSHAVPEPDTVSLLAVGAVLFGIARWLPLVRTLRTRHD